VLPYAVDTRAIVGATGTGKTTLAFRIALEHVLADPSRRMVAVVSSKDPRRIVEEQSRIDVRPRPKLLVVDATRVVPPVECLRHLPFPIQTAQVVTDSLELIMRKWKPDEDLTSSRVEAIVQYLDKRFWRSQRSLVQIAARERLISLGERLRVVEEGRGVRLSTILKLVEQRDVHGVVLTVGNSDENKTVRFGVLGLTYASYLGSKLQGDGMKVAYVIDDVSSFVEERSTAYSFISRTSHIIRGTAGASMIIAVAQDLEHLEVVNPLRVYVNKVEHLDALLKIREKDERTQRELAKMRERAVEEFERLLRRGSFAFIEYTSTPRYEVRVVQVKLAPRPTVDYVLVEPSEVVKSSGRADEVLRREGAWGIGLAKRVERLEKSVGRLEVEMGGIAKRIKAVESLGKPLEDIARRVESLEALVKDLARALNLPEAEGSRSEGRVDRASRRSRDLTRYL